MSAEQERAVVDRTLWFSPLTFEGIVGRSFVHDCYRDLFGPDGFARPKAELLADPKVRKAMPDADEIERDAVFVAHLAPKAQ